MDYDLLIVGAGPAGLSTGLHLAHIAPDLAQRTLILEKEHHPRPKLCAGGVLPNAEACLRQLGLNMDAIPSEPVKEITLLYEGIGCHIRGRPQVFRTVRRDQFDAWLAAEAQQRGLTLQEGTTVEEVSVRDGVARVRTNHGELKALAVVGADGSRGVVRRAVSSEPPTQVSRVLEIRLPAADNRRAHQALFDFSWTPDQVQGYFWSFPSPAGAQEETPMRTWGVYDGRLYRDGQHGSLKTVLEEGLAEHHPANPDYSLEGHPLHWFHPRAPLSAPHVILAGDAAGVDPVVGEGISFALGYGQVAAYALQDAFARQDFSFRDYRRRVLRHRTGRYLRRRYWGARLLYGLRTRLALRLVWRLVGPLASAYFIDWTWNQKD